MIGQAQVTEPLMTALRTERIGHAYLFSGPRGCGKTTSARILARCLNCAEGPTDTPCGVCPSCIELSREGGGSLDVVEIDAASHGGVDDARDLRERAVFAPARDRYKIFIIDEAHMVTSGGFNALLKIVEEPPPHVKFIFATTEPDKVIGTIRSRTHHYPFRLIAPGTLIDYAQQLCEGEGIEVEPGVLSLVVRAGGGSVRDTLSILDQLIAGSEGSRVTLDRATGLLGFTSGELLDEVVAALGSGDSAAAFAATDRVVQTGLDPRRFVEDLLERLRDLIVVSATSVQGASAVFRGVSEDQLQRMFEQAQAFPKGLLSRIADTVGAALDHMTGATAPRLHLELMVARALAVAHAAPAARPAAPPPALTSEPPAAPAATSAASPASAAPSATSAEPPAPAAPPAEHGSGDVIAALRSARDFLENDSAGAAPEAEPSAPQAGPEPVQFSELAEMWPELLQELLESDRDAWNAVRNVRPLALEGELLTVGIASRSDLELFKSVGSTPLREAIEAAFGVTVKYRPKAVNAAASAPDAGEGTPGDEDGAQPASEREPESAPEESSPRPEPSAESPMTAAADPPAETPEFSEPPAPAWSEPTTDPAPEAAAPEPETAAGPESTPQPVPEPEPAAEPVAEPESAEPGPDSPPGSAPSPEPITGRYGEAVVREVLSARFLEERPLPQSET